MATGGYPYLGAFLQDPIFDFQLADGLTRDAPEFPFLQPDAAVGLDGTAEFGFVPAHPHQHGCRLGSDGWALLDDDLDGGEAAPACGIAAVAHAYQPVAEAFGKPQGALLVRIEFLDDVAALERREAGKDARMAPEGPVCDVPGRLSPSAPGILPAACHVLVCPDWPVRAAYQAAMPMAIPA